MSIDLLDSQQFARSAHRFLRTPKGLLLLILLLLAAVAAPTAGLARVLPNVATGLFVAVLIDAAGALWTRDRWGIPGGALLTGLIVALVMSPTTPTSVIALTTAFAVASKYVLRTRRSNVFNPAALALVVACFAFGSGESWRGALPDLPTVAVVLLVVGGVFIADRVNRLPLALVFLGAFFGLCAAATFVVDPVRVAEVFRAPDANAALFLALFMLTDPPTSPNRYADQIAFGLIAATVSVAIYLAVGAVYYLPAGALAVNAFNAARRRREERRAPPGASRPPVSRQRPTSPQVPTTA